MTVAVVMLFSANGKSGTLPETQVRSMGRTATGVRSARPRREGDGVISTTIVPRGEGDILTVTQKRLR